MRDKLTSFILKNPPEPKKGSKVKKADGRAEEERLKVGKATDEELKKLEKEVKKKVSSTPKDGNVKVIYTKKKASGSDEYYTSVFSTSPTLSHADENEDDDVRWQTDTSMEATRQRIQEQLSTVTADMVMLSTNEPEKSKTTSKASDIPKIDSPYREISKVENGNSTHKRLLVEMKADLKKGVAANGFQSFFGSLSGSAQEVIMTAFYEAIFEGIEKGFDKAVAKKKRYFVAAAASSN